MITDYDKIVNAAHTLESNRTDYYTIWRWAATFSGSLNNIKETFELGDYFKGRESIPADIDSAKDPSILNLFSTVARFYSALFFPENSPFEARPIDDDSGYKDDFELINKEMYRNLRLRETNFQDSKEKSYYDYVVFGTKALMALENPDDDFPFWVSNYSIQNMAFNPARDTFLLGFKWTADQIITQLTNGENIGSLPRNILEAYNSYNFDNRFDVKLFITKNRDYSKTAERGKNSFRYVGYWLLNGVGKIFKTDYYKEKPISESLYSVRTGEIYGRSPLIDEQNGFKILDGCLYMITNNIAKIGDPATGYFDVGAINGIEYDTTPGTMSPWNAGLIGGSAPTFKIQDVGDITPAVQYLQPRLYESLRMAYGADAIVDLMTQDKQMTATEIMTVENLRNKILAPQIRRETSELIPFKKRLFLLTARWLNRRGEVSDEFLQGIESGQIKWDISENSSVERIIESENISQFNSELNVIAASIAVKPEIATAVDIYDGLKKVLTTGKIPLISKDKYEKKIKEMQDMAILQQLGNQPAPKNDLQEYKQTL